MEINRELPFTANQLSLLDMHSVLNLLNLTQHQLLKINSLLKDPKTINELCRRTANLASVLIYHERALTELKSIQALMTRILTTVDELKTARNLETNELFQSYQTNLVGIFEILKLRSEEITERSSNPKKWTVHQVDKLKANFSQIFQAIERNTHGGYRIVSDPAEHSDNSYLVRLEINSPNSETLFMPPVFQDVMRDLLANSRKYTPLGGIITAELQDNDSSLRFVVQDNGSGIPEKEIHKVIEFGYRASNAEYRRTMGGGMGLTKAYYITKFFDGQMWIDSPTEEGKGTRIEIRIPYPNKS